MTTLPEVFEFGAKVLRVIDGDTLVVEVSKEEQIDWGFSIKTKHSFVHKLKIRLHGLNTPETRGPKAKVEKEAGLAATAYVRDWLDLNCAQDRHGAYYVILRSHDARRLAPGKYHDRWIAEITSLTGLSLNKDLVLSGHAVEVEY